MSQIEPILNEVVDHYLTALRNRDLSPEQYLGEDIGESLNLSSEKIVLMCSLEMAKGDATDQRYKERVVELLYKIANNGINSRTPLDDKIDAQVTVNIKSQSFTIPDHWITHIMYRHDRLDKRIHQQITFLQSIPVILFKQLVGTSRIDLQVGIINWHRLVSKQEVSQKTITLESATIEKQIQEREIWITTPVARDYSKINIYIQSRGQYDLWRKQDFKLQMEGRLIFFTSCAKYKLCQKCKVSYTNTHTSSICPRKKNKNETSHPDGKTNDSEDSISCENTQ